MNSSTESSKLSEKRPSDISENQLELWPSCAEVSEAVKAISKRDREHCERQPGLPASSLSQKYKPLSQTACIKLHAVGTYELSSDRR